MAALAAMVSRWGYGRSLFYAVELEYPRRADVGLKLQARLDYRSLFAGSASLLGVRRGDRLHVLLRCGDEMLGYAALSLTDATPKIFGT